MKEISGDSDFVDSLLSAADEKSERRYALKRSGYDLAKTAKQADLLQ